MRKIWIIVGTRPELIKLAPVVHELKRRGMNYEILNTAQHKDLLEPYWKVFNITPTFSLNVMREDQNLSELTSRALLQMQDFVFKNCNKIKCIIAQGDTTSVMCASICAFYNQIPFFHVEAGLRSNNFKNPFPEEYNRRVAAIWCQKHFAPTKKARENLLNEGIESRRIEVTGNTVVDAVQWVKETHLFKKSKFSSAQLNRISPNQKKVLVTCHRRENHGANLRQIVRAIEDLTRHYDDYFFIWLLHPNPNVKRTLINSDLSKNKNILLHKPVDYLDLIRLMNESAVIITDSGGIQEEAPSFGKPVIVMREITERPEAIDLGLMKLAGADNAKIAKAFKWAVTYKNKMKSNPYGDGRAAQRIVRSLAKI